MCKILTLIFACISASVALAQNGSNPALKKQLDSIMQMDHLYRETYTQANMPAATKDSLVKAFKIEEAHNLDYYLQNQQIKIDRANLQFIDKVIEQYGYPDKAMVGIPENIVAWSVILHSNKVHTYFPLIEQAGKKGTLPMYCVATMQDYLLMRENKPQLYGTQLTKLDIPDTARDRIDRPVTIWPVQNAATINDWRKKAGFTNTIQEYAMETSAAYNPDLTVEAVLKMQLVRGHNRTDVILPSLLKDRVMRAHAIDIPEKEQDSSTFNHYLLAKRCSAKKDSIGAAHHLLQVSPYYLMFMGAEPKTLNKFISQFQVTDGAKTELRKNFLSVYETTQTPAYDTFWRYYTDIIKLRHLLDSVPGELKPVYLKELKKVDSAAMEYTHKYVVKHNWPSMADGSLYAGYIAPRDVEYYYDYLSPAEDAFLKGELPASMARRVENNKDYYIDYLFVKQKKEDRIIEIDISPFQAMKGFGFMNSPPLAAEIFRCMKTECPKDIMVVHYVNKIPKTTRDFFNDKTVNDFYNQLSAACLHFNNTGNGKGLWLYYLPNNYFKEEKGYFYLLYDKEK